MLLFLAMLFIACIPCWFPYNGAYWRFGMPIKVFFPKTGDPYVEADSPHEALALLKLGSNGHFVQPLRFARTETEEDNVAQFFLAINDNGRKSLLALLKHEKGVRGEQFSEETGIAAEKFGGIFGGASKIAKKYGLKIKHFVGSEMVVSGSERYRYFRPGKLLLENAEKLKQAAKEGTRG
jgi:hypothetical protein